MMFHQFALKQIEFARSYTLSLLADIAADEWFVMPAGCTTHVAWQVGHLAMAEYGLCLFRQRGRAEIDTTLMTSSFRKAFSRGTIPTMVAKLASGQSIEQAAAWAKEEIAGFTR